MRLVVKFRDGYTNIVADRLEREDDVVYAYRMVDVPVSDSGNCFLIQDKVLAGVFDLGSIEYMYLSEKKEDKK